MVALEQTEEAEIISKGDLGILPRSTAATIYGQEKTNRVHEITKPFHFRLSTIPNEERRS